MVMMTMTTGERRKMDEYEREYVRPATDDRSLQTQTKGAD